jgi:hypothetical protein
LGLRRGEDKNKKIIGYEREDWWRVGGEGGSARDSRWRIEEDRTRLMV